MTTVAILPISDVNGDRIYQAIALQPGSSDRSSTGRTAGEALDALTAQLGQGELHPFFVIQNFQPDGFFSAEQQARLSKLMERWRILRDRNETLPSDEQAELDQLVADELKAATARSAALSQQLTS
ncbi:MULTISPECIES: hypothetical protein [Leptolyngbya]|uniref:hypothetical protein n=1 Tax=Leptolyngbya TaxID=47251 RepID=UPI001683FE80|nr:hypothetical protein [Leptolyngbya sp. FACHB-1624]MBD1854491.1 hypothetical protein [Leptolyngbya sp. FACHB-1624]